MKSFEKEQPMALGDGIRRNIATVTQEEQDRFRDAIIQLHTNFHFPGSRGDSPTGGVSYWFKQDEIHAHSHVHFCPAFLPWHRELCNRFEAMLRLVDPQLSLHYWDWTTDPGWMFTSNFMGSPTGQAGAPWLTAGFYNPTANPFRSDNEFDPNNNPFDPPQNLTRNVQAGAPFTAADDQRLRQNNLTYQDFDNMMENSSHNDVHIDGGFHGIAHGWIGGTLGNQHTSFRDPFVFLLHSNIDRLFAMWQRDPAHPTRLDPTQIYGTLSTTIGSGDVLSGDPSWGILSPMEPWAGANAQTPATGIIANVFAVRPWAPPENQQVYKDSKDPSVVKPPSYDTTPHSSYMIFDRDTFSADEVSAAPSVTNAFSIIYDGFAPQELGTPINLPAFTLTFDAAGGPAVGSITATAGPAQLEDPGGAVNIPQRITFPVNLQFADTTAFNTFAETRFVHIRATNGSEITDAAFELIKQPNPYMLDGPISWLSTDVRVFQMRPGMTFPGVPSAVQDDPNTNANAPYQFINNLLTTFNGLPNNGSHPFLGISLDEQGNPLERSRTVGGVRVLNYAVAKVHYRANSVSASNVKVFFRLFNTMLSAIDYNTGTNYRRGGAGTAAMPLLGIIDGQIASMPFFATQRIDSSTQDMSTQLDPPNEQTINATPGQESIMYFGCWLDFNQSDPQFPLNPTTDGHFSSRLAIPQLIRGHHQCLVAEIFFQPDGTDPIPFEATPASSDRLSQRNLAIVESDNPGNATTHTVQHTFMIQPTPLLEGFQENTALARGRFFAFDELMIRWNNLPRDTKVTLYIPEKSADEILAIADLRQHPTVLSKVDDHTIACQVADVGFIPIPVGTKKSFAGLISLELPQHVRDGQLFTVDVQQYSRMRRKFLGSFRLTIPVRLGDVLLPREVRKLAVLRYVANAIPAGDRWSLIFTRYLAQIADKIRGLGGDPDQVPPSLDDPQPGPERGPRKGCISGKVRCVLYDCFGEFEGFVLEDCERPHSFVSREHGIEQVVRRACRDRSTLTVCTEGERIHHLMIECGHSHHHKD